MNYFFITGTSRGIGKAIAELCLEKGHCVYGFARNKRIDHKEYYHLTMDLSKPEKVSEFKFPSQGDADKLVLINNAGTLGEVKHLGNLSNEDIIDSYSVNVIAPAILMNNFIKAYQDQPAEKLIINVTSGAAQNPYDGWGIYCSSKAAIDMLSRVGVSEQSIGSNNHPIKILALAPGVVQTRMQEQIRTVNTEDFSRKEKFINLYENEQLYDPKDVAKEFIKIINDPASVGDVIHRIVI